MPTTRQGTIEFPARKSRDLLSSSAVRKSRGSTSKTNAKAKTDENVVRSEDKDLIILRKNCTGKILCDGKSVSPSGRGSKNCEVNEFKENSPLKRINQKEVASVLVSPSKRVKHNVIMTAADSLASRESPFKQGATIAINHTSPFKSTIDAANNRIDLVMSIAGTPLKLSVSKQRDPLTPRHDGTNVCYTPSKLDTLSQTPIIENSNFLNEARVPGLDHSSMPRSGHKMLDRLLSPECSRVLRSGHKEDVETACKSPGKVVRRNLDESFAAQSPKKYGAGMVSAVKLARANGIGYQLARKALHTAPPSVLIGREKEAAVVSTFLHDHVTSKCSGSLYISGAPGTGKTAVLTKAMEQIKSSGTCHVVYVNCMSTQNAQGVYNSILCSLDESHVQLSAKQARCAVEAYLKKATASLILVLDEIDSLDTRNQDVLYTIFDWPSLPDSAPLILVGVANSLDLTDRILPRLQARASCRPSLLHFPPYTKDQIVAVINDRFASVGVEGSGAVFDAASIQFVARKVSSMSGDVRMAIDICRRALESVEMEATKQLILIGSPSKTAPQPKKVGLVAIKRIIDEVYGVRVTTPAVSSAISADARCGVAGGGGGGFPLQQTLCICTLLLLLKGKSKEITLGKFHESYTRVCKRNGVTQIDMSEFLSLCTLIEARGIMSLKKAKDTRSIKASLRMNEDELSSALQDRTLMSSILEKGLC